MITVFIIKTITQSLDKIDQISYEKTKSFSDWTGDSIQLQLYEVSRNTQKNKSQERVRQND